jgi:hypothetical protein
MVMGRTAQTIPENTKDQKVGWKKMDNRKKLNQTIMVSVRDEG